MRRLACLTVLFCLAAAEDRPTVVRSPDGSVELHLAAGWLRTENVARGDRAVKLTCRHPRRDAYLAVVAESADVPLADYAAAVAEHLTARLQNAKRTPWAAVTVAGRDGLRCEFTGTVGKAAIGYVVTVMRTEAGFAQVVGWTAADHLADDRALLADAADGLR